MSYMYMYACISMQNEGIWGHALPESFETLHMRLLLRPYWDRIRATCNTASCFPMYLIHVWMLLSQLTR